ncbi:uncharacterized protein F5Z01DRAFT_638401 [Emericellopsis atlantica]|uniref:Condensation domain-containing protein n=1 Tax=Emericellopsis atlantica TaxID=2614577 RepID=A0A9P7ZIW8_9HYPO|nr:uncharacterized protein F5Z01DRAFT_638401 [Emericellopsis atlantica]KAG9252531.1 hypothetical protein F5Z01DRAFT_638401 [Emericellopsis atlantica]
MCSRTTFHPWAKSEARPELYSRTLTTPEFVLAMLNEYALGQSCPSLGVTVSVDRSVPSTLDIQTLSSRLEQAFIATRWTHPTVAIQVRGSKEMIYRVHDAEGVATWAKRTVQYVEAPGGWLAKYEQLSREAVLPTAIGDSALLHLVMSPEQASKSQITEFDLLLHVHHSLVDGAGLRTIMNYILTELATSDSSISFSWGEEGDSLQPAALDAAPISNELLKSLAQMPKEISLPPLVKPDEARRGTGVVTYTIPNAHNGETEFLSHLRTRARANNVRLAATIQAALVITLYDEVKPTEDKVATVISGVDLRARDLNKPWGERNRFVGFAVGLLEIIRTPVSLLEDLEGEERFWTVAQQIQNEWNAVSERQDVAALGELRRPATAFVLQMALAGVNKSSPKLDMSVNYVSDPPGDNQFDGVYQDEQSRFKLARYQLVTDESTPRLSCRSHSWNGELVLGISFSYKHHTRDAVQGFLDKWARLVESLGQSDTTGISGDVTDHNDS